MYYFINTIIIYNNKTYVTGYWYWLCVRLHLNVQVSGVHIVTLESKPIPINEPSIEKPASDTGRFL